MTDRTGWHCGACYRYLQTTASDPPTACPACGASGPFRRIEHERATIEARVGDVVACDIVGETHQYVVGEVVAVTGDRLVVQARDGTGRYEVTPDQVVGVR